MRDRVAASAHRFVLVTTDTGVLLGRLRPNALEDTDAAASAADAMEPTTTAVCPAFSTVSIQAWAGVAWPVRGSRPVGLPTVMVRPRTSARAPRPGTAMKPEA